MIRRLNRIRRKYLRRAVWRRWWRGPDRELARREWHWFRHIYLAKFFPRLLVLGLIVFYGCYPWVGEFLTPHVARLPIPAGLGIPRHISHYGLLSLALSLPVVLVVIGILHCRLRLHFHDAHIPHLLLSRIHRRELWPAILLGPAALLIAANMLALTSTIGQMAYQMIFEHFAYTSFSSLSQRLPTVMMYPCWLVFNILESLALLALAVVFTVPRFGWFRLFAIYFLLLNLNTVFILSVQTYWLRLIIGQNAWFKLAGEYAIMLRSIFELFTLIVMLSVVYILLLRWAMRRLRGEAFRRKLLSRISHMP